MKVEQLYTGCLAEAAYYIESQGEVAIIDPLRETAPYIKMAEERGAKIKYILETHFHADFVSGHLDLAKHTGAKIVYGPTAKPEFDAYVAKDEDELQLGDLVIKVLHTPGHTMESSTFLLLDEQGQMNSIFTGDTLFIGDVGRPDLAVKSDLSREDLAGYLYDSLRNKIMPLPDDIIVYPGHGAGSACGKNMSKETTDTLGNQKKYNYALRADMTKEEFVEAITEGLVAPPQYFPKNAVLNKKGYESFDKVLEQGVSPLTVTEVEKAEDQDGALILDVRNADDFAQGHIPGSWFIGLDGSFATWVGTVIEDLDQPLILVADEGREEEAVTRLSRVGYDNTIGYLKGGFNSWKQAGKNIATIDEVEAAEVVKDLEKYKGSILDVRKESEYESQHIPEVKNVPLDFINEEINLLSENKTYYVHCAGGYRSMIMASILKSRNFNKVINIKGGFKALEEAGAELTEYQAPATML